MGRKRIINKIKPGVPRRVLMFMAAVVWTFAGGILLLKGSLFLQQTSNYLLLKISVSLICGVLFYWFIFSRISLKHALRIVNLENENPCLFSFFNTRSYILMIIMISMGIFLRKSGIVPVKYMAILYLTMGIPLSLSAFRFYYFGFSATKWEN